MKTQYRNYDEIDLDILDTHIQAMTAEKLHGKAEIARELAWRDEQLKMKWQPIATAPVGMEMFIVKTFGDDEGMYTSDPWCVWQGTKDVFSRWPYTFPPTHWMSIPTGR